MNYDIVYSITAHEYVNCIDDMYHNIHKYNKNKKCLIVVNCNPHILSQKNKIPQYENLIFNPVAIDKIKYTSDIFFAHLDNYNYIKKFNFNFFGMLASNCMFIKDMDYEGLESNLGHLNITSYNDLQEWLKTEESTRGYYPKLIKNTKLFDIFNKHSILPRQAGHEGRLFRKEVFDFIFSFCEKNRINKFIINKNEDFVCEEVLFPSLEQYATGKVSNSYCIWYEDREVTEDIIHSLIQDHSNYKTIVKRIHRNPDNKIRNYIKEKL